jgi:2-polyprenyl-6-methoxyphenol hydroxylase-like FAD-dependent oxidoreductase
VCNSQPKSRSREDKLGQATVLAGLGAALGLHDLLALAGNLRQVRSRETWLTERYPRLAQLNNLGLKL